MRKLLFLSMGTLLLSCISTLCNAQVDPKWKIHDPDRPLPAIADPGTPSTQDSPGRPPSDAVVLFDGKDLSKWAHKDGSPAKWKVESGYLETVPKTGYIYTREAFGDCQLHVEFAEPAPPKGESQGRGNSGVFLMGLYEIQVLDSYENKTYADGQAAAVYGQYPPLVDARRSPAADTGRRQRPLDHPHTSCFHRNPELEFHIGPSEKHHCFHALGFRPWAGLVRQIRRVTDSRRTPPACRCNRSSERSQGNHYRLSILQGCRPCAPISKDPFRQKARRHRRVHA